MKEIIMPKFGFTHTEAEIVQWLRHEGDTIEKGEPICEVTTDKVNMEVEAPESGTLAGVRFHAGDVVPVTQVIAVVLEAGETLASAASPQAVDTPNTPSTAAPSTQGTLPALPNATPVALRVAQERGIDLSLVTGTGPGGRITREDVLAFKAPTTPMTATDSQDGGKVRATPNARRLANESHIDLSAITGSGPNGRVQGVDVVDVVKQSRLETSKPSVATPPIQPSTPSPQAAPVTVLPYAGMRKTIGTRLQQSYQQAPHVTFSIDVDVTHAEALRTRANAKLKNDEARISLTAILAKACAWALLRQPSMNARLDVDASQIVLNDAAHIGIAVALDNGLIVPVVRDVQAKGLRQIASDIADATARAKSNKLTPNDVGNGTFTISNLGMFGIDRFTAIINPPETAILAVGRATRKVVPDANDQPVVRPILTMTLSADHRVIDGAIAARFMSDLRDAVEQPDSILI